MLPIVTRSSCRMEALCTLSADGGKRSDLFSVTGAAATYCGIIMPEFKPPDLVPQTRASRANLLTADNQRRSENIAQLAAAGNRIGDPARTIASRLAPAAGEACRPELLLPLLTTARARRAAEVHLDFGQLLPAKRFPGHCQ